MYTSKKYFLNVLCIGGHPGPLDWSAWKSDVVQSYLKSLSLIYPFS